MNGSAEKPNRRDFLRTSLLSGGVFLSGFDKLTGLTASGSTRIDAFAGGQLLGSLGFVGENRAPLNSIIGVGLDARLYSDLSPFTPERHVTRTEEFYLRTGASERLEPQKPWSIQLRGLVQRPVDLAVDELRSSTKPMGLHLMECSGNARATRFGMISVADWAGAPISAVIESEAKPRTEHVFISGFDDYPKSSMTSVPGAEWMFTLSQLKASKAFLATGCAGLVWMYMYQVGERCDVHGRERRRDVADARVCGTNASARRSKISEGLSSSDNRPSGHADSSRKMAGAWQNQVPGCGNPMGWFAAGQDLGNTLQPRRGLHAGR